MVETTGFLKQKIQQLKLESRACRAQGQLFEQLIEMAGSAPDQELLKISMQRTLEVTAQLSGTDIGSLFLLNDQGLVTDSLLTRGEVDIDMKSRLIGSVLDQGLAGWVKTHLDVGLIHDTETDSRWLSLPSEPYSVRSALAVPIIRHNTLFGIITLMHPEPDHFKDEYVEIVQTAASQMALAIEMARLYIKSEELHHLRERAIERDLDLARQVQESFLPGQVPQVDGFEFAALSQPAHAVGGDFYHFFNLPRNRLGIAIGDVSGKGIAAALFMARLTSDLQYHAALYSDPADLFKKLNTILCGRSQQGMFVTMIYMILETDTGHVSWVNAGHLAPLHMKKTGVHMLGESERKGPPLGILEDAVWKAARVCLKPNIGILLYTDGIIEARNTVSELFGLGRLTRIARRYADEPAVMVRQITRAVQQFSQKNSQSDDLTLISCLRKEKQP
ncbi:MAG: SpoIIE family protein phosphatase [Desulfotignum sp.]|nr:SpoIIE family protein phosphatase [Desulfotignum sp.]MCF8124872.1 SpoIIE family protein phosphatase [Desulfotignum sp.]